MALKLARGVGIEEKYHADVVRAIILHEGGHVALNHGSDRISVMTWRLARPAAIAVGTMILAAMLIALPFLVPSLLTPSGVASLFSGAGLTIVCGLGVARWDFKRSTKKVIKEARHKKEFEADEWAARQNQNAGYANILRFRMLDKTILTADCSSHPPFAERADRLEHFLRKQT